LKQKENDNDDVDYIWQRYWWWWRRRRRWW